MFIRKEGRREGGREGRKEGGREGRKEGGRKGGREGRKEWLASDALVSFCLCFPSAQITDIFTVSGFFVVNFS